MVADAAAFHMRAIAHGARELSPSSLRDWGHRVAYSLTRMDTFSPSHPSRKSPNVIKFSCKVAIRHDITNLKLAEEQIREQTAELQRAAQLSVIGELAAGLAHEVKNPLAGIQGAVDILIRRRDSKDPEREALEGVRHQVERIDATVRALLRSSASA